MLYALIALGFVLIFKASGVFNFAQGIMVVFAALTLVGLYTVLRQWGVRPSDLAAFLALGADDRRDVRCSRSASNGSCCGRWSISPTSSCSWRRSA